MSMVGVFIDGDFMRCAEVPRGIPQCMGRMVNFTSGCTCPAWSSLQVRAAFETGATAASRTELCDALMKSGWTYRAAMVLVYPEDKRFTKERER